LLSFVSGAIAAIVATVQLIVPDALVILLVSLLSESHSGVTWSAVGRVLSNSNWPMFLRSDQTASQNVPRWVNLVIWVKPLTLSLIAVAAIVTPIGLYETIEASKDLESAAFFYIPDKGPMGLGTPLRSELGFSRVCGESDPIHQVCPGSSGSTKHSVNERGRVNSSTAEGLDYRIPHKLTELYQSGLTSQSPTVSSFFDIQARLFKVLVDKSFGNSTYLIDVYRHLGTFILDDKIQAVEGLVVDTQHPKIGFRNHTAPTNVQYGAEWEEDLLFLEPETKCVDVNISLQLEISPPSVHTMLRTAHLVDKGGFANMNITSPWPAWMMKKGWYGNTQENPALDWRAQAIGWSMNVLLAYFFNVTKPGEREAYMNSQVGKLFPVNVSYDSNPTKEIEVTRTYYTLVGNTMPPPNYKETVAPMDTHPFFFWPNPFNISELHFTLLPELCDGIGPTFDHKANMTTIQVMCGLMVGAAHPIRGEKTLIPQLGTMWEYPIYSCASTTKASIKNVRFRFNSTNNDAEPMKDLEVLDIVDKVYSNRNEMPLWGVEDANMRIDDVDPLWGLIDPSWKTSVNLSIVRAERLYLPAGRALTESPSSDGSDFIPAITGPAKAWARVYKGLDTSGDVDYSGKGGLALYNKWDKLSQTAEGAAQILNLIFTDYAANNLVGTRSQLTPTNRLPNLKRDDKIRPGEVPVRLYHRVIRYRWVYGIPAVLSLLVVAFIFVGAIVALLTGRGSIKFIKHYLWNLSAGRILTTFIYPGSSHMYSNTKEWIRVVGANNIIISHDGRPQGGFPVNTAEVGSGHGAVRTSYHRLPRHEPAKVVTNDAIELRSASESMKSVLDYDESRASSTDAVISR
jgi:hypothetical protein